MIAPLPIEPAPGKVRLGLNQIHVSKLFRSVSITARRRGIDLHSQRLLEALTKKVIDNYSDRATTPKEFRDAMQLVLAYGNRRLTNGIEITLLV